MIDGDVEWVDEHRRATGHLSGRTAAARHDGRPARHRLQHRDPEALVERREDERAGAAVERSELAVGDLADPTRRFDAAPAPCADDTQLDADAGRGVGDAPEVLTRLERRDREHVVALGGRALGREDRFDRVPDHDDAFLGDAEQLHRLALGELGDGEDPVRRPRDAARSRRGRRGGASVGRAPDAGRARGRAA